MPTAMSSHSAGASKVKEGVTTWCTHACNYLRLRLGPSLVDTCDARPSKRLVLKTYTHRAMHRPHNGCACQDIVVGVQCLYTSSVMMSNASPNVNKQARPDPTRRDGATSLNPTAIAEAQQVRKCARDFPFSPVPRHRSPASPSKYNWEPGPRRRCVNPQVDPHAPPPRWLTISRASLGKSGPAAASPETSGESARSARVASPGGSGKSAGTDLLSEGRPRSVSNRRAGAGVDVWAPSQWCPTASAVCKSLPPRQSFSDLPGRHGSPVFLPIHGARR